MQNGPTLKLPEVATALSITETAFRNKRADLERTGFPKPLPVLGSIWSRAQVEAWIAANGEPPADDGETIVDFVAAQRAALDRKYGGRA